MVTEYVRLGQLFLSLTGIPVQMNLVDIKRCSCFIRCCCCLFAVRDLSGVVVFIMFSLPTEYIRHIRVVWCGVIPSLPENSSSGQSLVKAV